MDQLPIMRGWRTIPSFKEFVHFLHTTARFIHNKNKNVYVCPTRSQEAKKYTLYIPRFPRHHFIETNRTCSLCPTFVPYNWEVLYRASLSTIPSSDFWGPEWLQPSLMACLGFEVWTTCGNTVPKRLSLRHKWMVTRDHAISKWLIFQFLVQISEFQILLSFGGTTMYLPFDHLRSQGLLPMHWQIPPESTNLKRSARCHSVTARSTGLKETNTWELYHLLLPWRNWHSQFVHFGHPNGGCVCHVKWKLHPQ